MIDFERPIAILVADDDADDRMLMKDALVESRLADELTFVEDGEQLLDYLHRRGEYADPAVSPRPGLILLDLNMPRKDGRETLREIKSDTSLRSIPVVVLTTSSDEEDIISSYDLGASSYIVKPETFEELLAAAQILRKYWFEVVALPPVRRTG